MNKSNKNIVIKIGITPSEAPFRITCLRTFLYITAIAENNVFKGGNSKIIFQIDDTNAEKRKHSNEEIIEFYKLMGILPFKYSDYTITTQTDLKDKCEEFFNLLDQSGLIIHNQDNTCSFNINKYSKLFGSVIEVKDSVNGNVKFDTNKLSETNSIIIKRSDGSFLYNFSAAVDTIYWNFTTIIRGNNKMSSAAFQNMFIKALGYETPDYLHLPLLLEEKRTNEFEINARSDIRKLFENGFSYMPVLNYLLSTGYGDQTDTYCSLEEFIEKFDVSRLHRTNAYFDFNIMKKTCNRFFQQEISFQDYYNQLVRHVNLMGWDKDLLNYSNIGYKHKLSPQKVYQLYTQMLANHLDTVDEETKKKIIHIIDILTKFGYEKAIELLLADKQNKKENIKLVKYILSGYFDGLICDVYKDCYSDDKYSKRLIYVRNMMLGGNKWKLAL